jgi:hypothetical protein
MRVRQHLVGLGLLVTAGFAVPAFGQTNGGGGPEYPQCTKAVSTEESEKAHQRYLAGRAEYNQSQWDSAIANFVDAYRRDCTKHELLVIISRAYEQKHNWAEAIRALETYLARVKDAPDRVDYEGRIRTFKAELAAQQAGAASTSPPPPATSAAPTATPSAAASTPPPGAEPREHTVFPWLVVAVGGAAVVTGISLLVAAPTLPPNCTSNQSTCDKSPPTETDAQLQSDKDRAGNHVSFITFGTILIITGVAVAGGGVLWHFLEPTGPTTGMPRVTPQVGPGFAGASLGGAF